MVSGAIRKSACSPFWVSVCVILTAVFATTGGMPLRMPAATGPGDHVSDHVRKVQTSVAKGEVNVGVKKVTSHPRPQAFASTAQTETAPALVRFYSSRIAEHSPLVNLRSGTFQERAPPA